MFGLPPGLTDLTKIEVELCQGDDLNGLVAGLRSKIPTLAGNVISAKEDKLLDNYAFIVNGHYYLNDGDVRLQDGDRVVLVLLAIGG